MGVWKAIRLAQDPVGYRVLFNVGNGRWVCFSLDR